ncbi:MAG TPA: ATP-binding protein [Anaerolineae bacterium]|nr:ATP-binding protein [Anaerolineae bacterium]HQI87554.1 ATP-binding protein [Anaerolineae bacterium]
MNLYHKGLLAFAVVILIAVLTVAILVGQQAESNFRSYNALYSVRAQTLAQDLAAYYAEHGSWDGLQAQMGTLATMPGRRQGRGGMTGGNTMGGGMATWNFRVADADGRIVADSAAAPAGKLTTAEQQRALPIRNAAAVIGYLLPDREALGAGALDEPAQRYLDQLRGALLVGGLVAFAAALLLAGLLTRGIVAPVRRLTQATQAIAAGNLDARAPVHGHDEIAELSQTFNAMSASLQRAEQARRAQTADIAHELRNPLSVLQGTLEALADGVYEPTPDNIEPALDQVRTLNRLVGDLRTLALADAGELRLERQPVDIGALLEHAAEGYREVLTDHGLTLDYTPAPHPLTVHADYERLTQVVGNILSNAARYVPAGGHVQMTARAAQNGVEVTIADNGPGVSDADLPHIFERFWRGDPSRSRTTGGSGLGLAIARHIILAHGGRIWAAPTPGGGLTVAFWLPGSGSTN